MGAFTTHFPLACAKAATGGAGMTSGSKNIINRQDFIRSGPHHKERKELKEIVSERLEPYVFFAVKFF
jgi:hypothetical protein